MTAAWRLRTLAAAGPTPDPRWSTCHDRHHPPLPHPPAPAGSRGSAAALLAVSVLTPLAAAWAPTPAGAAGPTIVGTAPYRDCTRTTLAGCATRGSIPNGAAVKMHCWIDDSTVTERYASNRWFYVAYGATRGFVHSSRVVNQVTVGNCASHRGIAPSRWAAMKVGSVSPTTTEARGTGARYWSSWCYLFAADAHIYGYNNTPLTGYGTAKATFAEYKRRGLVSTNMDPNAIAIGSIVFWTFGTAGHAAIYVGNGYVVSTQGSSESQHLPVARLPLGTWNRSGSPAGWVTPASV